VDSAQVNFGAERAVLTYDPTQVDMPALRDAVEKATGFQARVRTDPGSARTEDAEDETRRAEVRDLKVRLAVGVLRRCQCCTPQWSGSSSASSTFRTCWSPFTQLVLTLPVFLWVG
jgi:Cu+-exporting ATPase